MSRRSSAQLFFSLALLCVSLLCLSALGILGYTQRAHASAGDGSPDDPNIIYIGRWDTSSNTTVISNWGGAYFKTTFTGTHVQIKLGDTANLFASIDGGDDINYENTNGTVNLTPSPLSSGSHSLRVSARSEFDHIHFQGLVLDNGATTVAPTVSSALIEFVGDSITAGFTDSKTALSDYAWLAGERLNVEHTQIAYTGICLVGSCTSSSDSGMNNMFFKTGTTTDTTDWNFSRYQAREVVINLGTNDYYNDVADDTFRDAYSNFLQHVRQKYPDAIILVLRTFLGYKDGPTQDAVQAVNNNGDSKVHYIDTSGWSIEYNDGVHPSDYGHEQIADYLTPILSNYLGSVPTPTPTPDSVLPSPWQTQDVGSVGVNGSASYNRGTFTVKGGGADIWNNADGFRSVHQSLMGDGTIIARVVSQQNTDGWAKAGVMIRETLTAGSKHTFMALTPGNGSAFQSRASTNGGSDHTSGAGVNVPYWVRLQRTGTTFTGSISSDGSNWTQVGSVTMSMATNVSVGFAVTSHNNSNLSTATFSNVSLTTGGTTTTPTPTATATPSTQVKAINTGGGASGSWVADTGFNAGNQYSDTSASITTTGVSNPAPQVVYQSCRWNDAFTYTVGSLTVGASYKVRLHFAELTFDSAGQRVFNVGMNGSSVLSNFDVAAQAGLRKALVKEFTVTANSSGQIVIAFTQGSADNPFVSGIEVVTA